MFDPPDLGVEVYPFYTFSKKNILNPAKPHILMKLTEHIFSKTGMCHIKGIYLNTKIVVEMIFFWKKKFKKKNQKILKFNTNTLI